MKKIFGFALTILTFASCTQASDSSAPPAAIKAKIESTAAVKGEYLYNGKQVFLVSPTACCDIPESLVDKDGNRICILGGGFANQTEDKCKDFKTTAKLVKSFAPPKKDK